ncbi:MAG: nucleotidyltransferase family protein [Nitrospirae bacterium]|nr:nucleotidyltransferase family protein [Nitrospirota bacterium]
MDLTAMILAGGLGKRLQPVVPDRQKVLAEVDGRPFLAVLLDQIGRAGVRHAVLCTGHKGDQVRSSLGDRFGAVQLSYSHETQPLGTAGALRHALPLAESDPILALNGDSYCQADLQDLVEWHQRKHADGTLALVQVPDAGRFGLVRTDAQDRVIRFDEKGGHEGPGWISAGIYVLSRKLLATIPEGRAVSIETEMFPLWTREQLFGFRLEGRFLDIGTPDSYAVASEFFRDPSCTESATVHHPPSSPSPSRGEGEKNTPSPWMGEGKGGGGDNP